ncbi:hypothetical protein HCI99_06140 [Listeria booriae]|uniref:Scaffolding protein n=1 Tax=Listeria booriae TaxID=1552123 RepID=A0A7X1CBH2_9LIST|nr:hypothetical protein [Listeria booriae]MBC1491401.1 hypothetical protein [Listeria booriae]
MTETNNEKQFTQEDMNELAKKVRGEEKRKYTASEQALKESYEEDVKKLNDDLKAEKQKTSDYDNLKQKFDEANEKIANFSKEQEHAELAGKLKELGVKEDRIDAFSKLLSEDKSDEALAKALEDYPEFKVAETPPKWSTGDTNNNNSQFSNVSKLSEQRKSLNEHRIVK